MEIQDYTVSLKKKKMLRNRKAGKKKLVGKTNESCLFLIHSKNPRLAFTSPFPWSHLAIREETLDVKSVKERSLTDKPSCRWQSRREEVEVWWLIHQKSLSSHSLVFSWLGLTNVDTMEIIGTKRGITLRTFALTGVIACLHTLKAENMKTLGQYGVLFTHVATRTGQACLKKKKKVRVWLTVKV